MAFETQRLDFFQKKNLVQEFLKARGLHVAREISNIAQQVGMTQQNEVIVQHLEGVALALGNLYWIMHPAKDIAAEH